ATMALLLETRAMECLSTMGKCGMIAPGSAARQRVKPLEDIPQPSLQHVEGTDSVSGPAVSPCGARFNKRTEAAESIIPPPFPQLKITSCVRDITDRIEYGGHGSALRGPRPFTCRWR